MQLCARVRERLLAFSPRVGACTELHPAAFTSAPLRFPVPLMTRALPRRPCTEATRSRAEKTRHLIHLNRRETTCISTFAKLYALFSGFVFPSHLLPRGVTQLHLFSLLVFTYIHIPGRCRATQAMRGRPSMPLTLREGNNEHHTCAYFSPPFNSPPDNPSPCVVTLFDCIVVLVVLENQTGEYILQKS